MNMNGLRNLITILFCAGEGIHALFPQVPLGVSTTVGLVIRAVMDQLWPAQPAGTSVTTPTAPKQ